MKMKKILAALTITLPFVIQGTANAQFDSIHKWSDGIKTYIFFPNIQGESTSITIPGTLKSRIIPLNACGWGKIKDSLTSPISNIIGISAPDADGWMPIPASSEPICTNGIDSTNEPIGRILKVGDNYWLKGGNTAGQIGVDIQQLRQIKIKKNACGWGRITDLPTRPLTNFQHNGTRYQLTNIPSATLPMICRKSTEGGAATYIPKN